MKVLVFGSGGVGGYFGGRLAQAGYEVTFVARGRHLDAINENGLRVESVAGDFSIHPARATDDPAGNTPDVILVATKAWDVPAVAEAIRPNIGPHTVVIPLSNGVDAPSQLAAALGQEPVLGGLCRISAFIGGPGMIRHVGVPPYIAFGELDGSLTPRVDAVKQAFASCQGLTVEIPADIRVAMWEKFIFIAAVSGLGSVTRMTVGDFRTVPETRALLMEAIAETAQVGRALGVKIPLDAESRVLGIIDNAPAGLTASMQKDILEGRPSELDAQNGAVVRLGRQAGIATPVHAFLYASLLPGERKARLAA